MVRAMARIGLNELVVKKDCWARNKVEQLVGIWDVWDINKFRYEEFGEICSIS